jgi:leucyl/phenylalanyl-tRNA--protein transferase
MIPYIIRKNHTQIFPLNLTPDENGLVALGGNLNASVIIEAYSKGIFPWSGDDPIPWYSPDPRLVLFPEQFHVSDSLRKVIKKAQLKIKTDTNFASVIHSCASIKRYRQRGTWIDRNIESAYTELFRLEVAHSVEVYDDEGLCGGLYGLALGKCFFGESMFARVSNASKIALYYLTRILIEKKFLMIDCQQVTRHMLSLGALPIPRSMFLGLLEKGDTQSSEHERWSY